MTEEDFKDPELKAYFSRALSGDQSQDIKIDPETKNAFELMSMLDASMRFEIQYGGFPKSGELDWEPKSPQTKEVIEYLKDPRYLPELKAWYARSGEMNSASQSFQDWLSHAVGEPLGAAPKPKPSTGKVVACGFGMIAGWVVSVCIALPMGILFAELAGMKEGGWNLQYMGPILYSGGIALISYPMIFGVVIGLSKNFGAAMATAVLWSICLGAMTVFFMVKSL